jgi:hypothetical protein
MIVCARMQDANLVMSTQNMERIQAFLDQPRKQLGAVMSQIETTTAEIYAKVGVTTGPSITYKSPAVDSSTAVKELRLEGLPELNKMLGNMSRFGEGDGSYWDRWLNTTGYSLQNVYHAGCMPTEVSSVMWLYMYFAALVPHAYYTLQVAAIR